MKTYILDSYALLCLFDKKRKREKDAIVALLEQAERKKIGLIVSKINEGEVFYRLFKYLGPQIAQGFREDLKAGMFPITVAAVNDKRAEAASVIKAGHPISYADAFCIALAKEMNHPVITGDPEFESVKDVISIERLVE
jgi:predicted nucleic acid-binding protein